MTDKLETAVRNGNRAATLLDDPVLNEALDKLRSIAVDALLECAPDELRERRADVVAIDKLRRVLRAYIDNGKLAKVTLSPSN